MCGIVGIYNYNSENQVNEKQIIAMRDIIVHRGRDGFGCFVHKNVGLGHRRLSIIDLSEGGKQPFISVDGRYVLTFNGEIFNYLELKVDLIKKGIIFTTESDTEVLLNMLILYGEGALQKLNGMFAFAFYDKQLNNLMLVRDRIGIKPLYYSKNNDGIYFGSEPKSILAAGINHDLNTQKFDELLIFRYISGEDTVFANIKRLLPGHLMLISLDNKIQIRKWWNLEDKIYENRNNLPENPVKWFRDTFFSSVKYRTISDVPVGLMLSGGLDSGAIAVALNENNAKGLSAFTITFKDNLYNEGDMAKLVANKFNMNYNPIELSGKNLRDYIREASWFYDEPLVHQNDPQMLAMSKFAKSSTTVLLSGEGGDEFMGGYVRYKPLNNNSLLSILKNISPLLNFIPNNGIINRFEKLNRYLKNSNKNNLVLYNSADVFPSDFGLHGIPENLNLENSYRETILKEAQRIYPNEMARQSMYMDLFIHMSSVLDRNDRMTMGAGIECRVPFMDYRLMEMLPSLPSNLLLKGKKGKHLLIQAIGKDLPKEILSFKKLGFSVPWEDYFINDESFKDYFSSLEFKTEHDLFPSINPSKLRKDFIAGNPVSRMILRHLFMVDEWNSIYKSRINSFVSENKF